MITSRRTKPKSLKEIEDLFVQKLQEKYRLTERDLNKAFSKFDKDGSGYLDVQELGDAISLFLNGVEHKDVLELVKRYDVDGDGSISIKEFAQLLSSRGNLDPNKWITVDHLVSPSFETYGVTGTKSSRGMSFSTNKNENRVPLTTRRVIENEYTEIDNDLELSELTKPEIAVQTRIFLKNLRTITLKQGEELKNQGMLPIRDHLTLNHNELLENIVRFVLKRAFNAFLRNIEDSDTENYTVDFPTFCKRCYFHQKK